jgi:hypothetical protein
MAFQVPPSKASFKQNRFEFQLPGSRKVFSVPLLKYVKPSLAIELEEASELGAVKLLFGEYLPEAFPLFEDGDQLGAFLDAWKEASGLGVGESGASADS